MSDSKKKTPSARVIAALWLQKQIDGPEAIQTLTGEVLTSLAESRVSDDKAEKVAEHVQKIGKGLLARLTKIIQAYKNPKTRSGSVPPNFKKKGT